MKKILIVLVMGVMLISCEDDEKGEGYLTGIEDVKNGIIGMWKNADGGQQYTEFFNNGIRCFGYPIDNLNSCMKYEAFKKGNDYILRVYYVGDTEGTGSFTDAKILKLDESELITYVTKENKYTRYIE